MNTTNIHSQAHDPDDLQRLARELGKAFLDELDQFTEETTTGVDTAVG